MAADLTPLPSGENTDLAHVHVSSATGTRGFTRGPVTVLQGDSQHVLATLAPNSVDAVVTDPPYGLSAEPDAQEVLAHWLAGDDYHHRGAGFMGKSWDSFVPGPSVWREVYRVLKPGGHALVFSSTRTYDLTVIALRLAGFEVRDSIHWVFGQGFPKSLNVAKVLAKTDAAAAERWQGWGTALKPSHEMIALVRKPLVGTVATNTAVFGTGVLNIDGCRVQASVASEDASASRADRAGEASAQRRYTEHGGTNFAPTPGPRGGSPDGRFPPNTVLTHSPFCLPVGQVRVKAPVINRFTDGAKPFGGGAGHPYESMPTGDADGMEAVDVFDCVLDCPVKEMDEQSGILTSGKPGTYRGTPNRGAAYGAESRAAGEAMTGFGDTGGASRFFPRFHYEAKAKRHERTSVWVPAPGCRPGNDPTAAGCGVDPHDPLTDWQHAASEHPRDCARCGTPWVAYQHSTVKPTPLMQWLVRLVTPAGGTVLDLYAGTGSTGLAAAREGLTSVLVERDPAHVAIIAARLAGLGRPDGTSRERPQVPEHPETGERDVARPAHLRLVREDQEEDTPLDGTSAATGAATDGQVEGRGEDQDLFTITFETDGPDGQRSLFAV